MPSYLAGMHDRQGAHILPPGGYCVDTIALSEKPAPTDYEALRGDINWIVRANWGYGTNGTIPLPTEYHHMAAATADYVRRSRGANIWIIGNEPNHEAERPQNVYITPEDYARCFYLCRNAIKGASINARVMPAACAPYHADPLDWLVYWRTMLEQIAANGGCDGLCVHAYTRSSNPEDIASNAKMGPPLEGQYSGFRTYIDALDNVPLSMTHLPAYLTEFNELLTNGWDNRNTGVVQAAYREIEAWNDGDVPKIQCLVLYRWPRHDKWFIEGKQGVIDDFRAAVQLGYQSPQPTPIPTPPEPQPPTPEPIFDREIDPVLAARGVEFDFISPAPGIGYWRIVVAEHLNEEQADAVGPDHHILGTVVDDGVLVAGVEMRVSWPSGSTEIVSKIRQPGVAYNFDFPMSASLNEFSIWVDDGNPSDKVSGIGMGAHGNPGIHTSTWIDFEWAIAEGVKPEPPTPEPPRPPAKHDALLWPVSGPVTTWFGEPPARFGQIGHNGIDIACALDTPVLAVAAGEVVYTGTDKDYGNYCRLFHRAYHMHSFYAHLAEVRCTVGQRVERGQTIALSGSTGNSTGPHLHLEFRGGTRDGYYNVTYGYTQGRFDPRAAYLVTGSPLDPGASL